MTSTEKIEGLTKEHILLAIGEVDENKQMDVSISS